MSSLAPIMEGFFTERLISQRHAGPHTVASYAGFGQGWADGYRFSDGELYAYIFGGAVIGGFAGAAFALSITSPKFALRSNAVSGALVGGTGALIAGRALGYKYTDSHLWTFVILGATGGAFAGAILRLAVTSARITGRTANLIPDFFGPTRPIQQSYVYRPALLKDSLSQLTMGLKRTLLKKSVGP